MIFKCIAFAVVISMFQCGCMLSYGSEETTEVSYTQNELKETERTDEGDQDPEGYVDYYAREENGVEGRGKKKKKMKKYLAVLAGIKYLLIMKLLGFVKLLTAKAYMVAVASLIFAALSTSSTAHHKEKDTEQIINLIPEHEHGRNLDSHDMAYGYWRTQGRQPSASTS